MLPGFDPEFADIPDYIVKVTERIWEGRGIGRIRDWYADDCRVHTTMGPSVGVPAVIAGTLDTLNAFPDRRLLAEDIIWSELEPGTYLSSHRVSAPARHDGDGAFGPPTGRELHFRAIADCVCRADRVIEEWLVRDQEGIALQLGLDPDPLAAGLAARDAAAGVAPWHLAEAERLRDTGRCERATLSDDPAAALVCDLLSAIYDGTDLDRINTTLHPAAVSHLPGAVTLHGHERLQRRLFGFLAAFPGGRFAIEHASVLDEPGLPARVAVRWWFTGVHRGHGRFGEPSGATVLLLGVTHANVAGGRIRELWTVADELALRKQIARHRLGT